MKLTIEGTPEEVKNVLQTIENNKEHKLESKVDTLESSLTQVRLYLSNANGVANGGLTKVSEILGQAEDTPSTDPWAYFLADDKTFASAVVDEKALTVTIAKPTGSESYKLTRV